MSIRVKIQNIRKKLNNLLLKEVIPLRDELHLLLKKEAVQICPFNLNDIITLENGKKGMVTEIDYYSLDYEFYEDKFVSHSFKDDDIIPEYLIDYSFDNKKFSITWEISGLRLRKNGEVGKISFLGISPVSYIIDVKNKIVRSKYLSDYMDDKNISELNEIFFGTKNNS